MKATIATTNGPITWESAGPVCAEVAQLVENWGRWVAGDNPRSFAHVVHDGGAFNIQYREIISIDIEEDQ